MPARGSSLEIRWPGYRGRLQGKNAIAIASNQSVSDPTDAFTDPRLCAAIVDRLTYNGSIIETGTHSYRLAHTRPAQRPPDRSCVAPNVSRHGRRRRRLRVASRSWALVVADSSLESSDPVPWSDRPSGSFVTSSAG